MSTARDAAITATAWVERASIDPLVSGRWPDDAVVLDAIDMIDPTLTSARPT